MFNKLTVSLITTTLAFSRVALAMPALDKVEARNEEAGVSVSICVAPNFVTCITVPTVAGTCVNLVGGLSGWNNEVSSARIQQGFVCTFFDNFSCLSSGQSVNGDSVTLQGGDYPSFASLPGDNFQTGSTNFADRASSFTCTPLI
ncbi:hypothetical protein NP233_g10924 [Leucocoprinus birnbaumii]|uniref:Uncharacterized protein n=1 Tax=Leucocoprinus birnbaumii TaxID=56174 RepID=A0AAD5VJV0_9AGAR|nr:hypothetical protein NP233_g10924 [Leucocoprinus birnbaumii]